MKTNESEEISLIELIKTLVEGKFLILKIIMIFFIIGLFIALFSNVEYQVNTRIMPEYARPDRAGTLIQQFGGLVGGSNLQGLSGPGTEALRPDLYPELVSSLPIMTRLLDFKVHVFDKDSTVTLESYFRDFASKSLVDYTLDYTIKLPFTVISYYRKVPSQINYLYHNQTRILHLTQEQEDIIQELKNRINATFDRNTGVISIIVEMPDRYIAAEVADQVMFLLTDYVKKYRIEKAMQDLNFIQERYNEAEEEFRKVQNDRATFRDENFNIVSARAQANADRLQAEYDLRYNIYNTLAQQLEQAKIKVQEETPVFQILEPISIPNNRFKPKRGLIIIISILSGLFISVSILLIKLIYQKMN